MTRICKQFFLGEEEVKKIRCWLEDEIYPTIVQEQRETFEDPHPMMIDMWNDGYPYEGAIGGGLTYEFTPTSVGTICNVRYGEHKLDITNYENW